MTTNTATPAPVAFDILAAVQGNPDARAALVAAIMAAAAEGDDVLIDNMINDITAAAQEDVVNDIAADLESMNETDAVDHIRENY